MADKTYLVNVESNLKKYADEAAEAKKKVDELKEANKALQESGTATTAEIEASNAALRNAQKEYNQAKKMVDLQTAANKSEIGSRKQLGEILKLQEQELGKLGNAYIKNAQGLDVLNPKYIEQRNRIAETKQQIIDYDLALNDGRSNVGRYRESLVQLNQILKSEEQQLKILEKTYKSDIAGRKELSSVLEAQKKKISDVKNAIGEQNKLISQESQNNIRAYGDTVKSAFTSAGKSILSMVSPMALITAGLAVAKKIFEGLKDAIMSTSGAMNAANIVGQMFKQTFYDIAVNGKLSAESMAAAAEAAKLMNEKRVGDRKDMVEFALLEREIAKLEFDAADKTKTRAERQDVLNQAINKQNELSDKKIAVAREDLRITQDLIALRPKDDKLRQKEAENIKRIIDLDKERFEQSKRNEGRLTAFHQEEIDARKKLFDDYYAWIDKENERKDKEAEDRAKQEIADELAGMKHYEQLKKEQKNKGKLIEEEKDQHLGLFDMFKKLQKETVEVAKEANIELGESDTRLTELKLDNEKLKTDAIVQGLSIFSEIIGAQTEAGKAFAIAAATIDTYAAANKVLNDPTIPSTFARIAMMITVILTGLANVKQILSVKVGKSTTPTTSVPTSISASIPTQRSFAAPAGSTIFTQPQLSQAQLNAVPNQSLLTADDISRALSKVSIKVSVEDINAKIKEVNKVTVRANI